MGGKILFLFFIIQVTVVLSSVYPPKCKVSDKECMLKTAQSMVPDFANGIPELGMDSLDILHIDKIAIDLAGLKLLVKNAEIKGLKNTVIEKVDLNMEKKQLVIGYQSDLNFKGKYKASGRLIILPISGNGDCIIKIKKMYVDLTMPFEIKKKEDGKEYLILKSLSYTFDIKEKAHFDLTNLFEGNEGLSKPLLKFMNENWKLVAQEFGGAITERPHQAIFEIIKKYLASQPLNNFIE